MEQCTRYLKDGNGDLIIGIGRGSFLDVAKGTSIMGTNEGSPLSFYGGDLLTKRGLPTILIPTTSRKGMNVKGK